MLTIECYTEPTAEMDSPSWCTQTPVATVNFSASMMIIDQGQPSWTLLSFRGNYFLDTCCEIGPYQPSLLIKLDESEASQYSRNGRSYINSKAAQIRSLPQLYFDRNQSVEMQQLVRLAISNPFEGKATAMQIRRRY